MNEELLKELKESILTHANRDALKVKAPDGYFDQLADDILSKARGGVPSRMISFSNFKLIGIAA